MVRSALPNSLGYLVLEDGTSHQRVIADNLILPMSDVRFCGFRSLIGPSKTLEPIVELRVAAVELQDVMTLRQLLDNEVLAQKPITGSQPRRAPRRVF